MKNQYLSWYFKVFLLYLIDVYGPSIRDRVQCKKNLALKNPVFSKKKIIKSILCNFSMRLLKYFLENNKKKFCPLKHKKTALKSCS